MSACPSAERFAEFADGALASPQTAELEGHLDECPRCRVVAAEMARAAVPGVAETPLAHRIGRFTLEERLGEGAMGVVYLARDPTLRRRVAIKVMHPRLAATADDAVRLVSEAQAAARLNHPNAVTIHEVGRDESQVFIVMEYVEGPTLRQLIEEGLHWRKAIEHLVAAGRGLEAAHEAGLIHRDFKPDNVIVGVDGRARVTDFGLARVDDALPPGASARLGAITANTTGAGTPIYMAPEQLMGDGASALSDQYAFAASSFLALYGQLPHDADSLVELTHLVISEPLPAPDASSPVPPAVHAVLAQGLSVDANDRFASMADLLDRLVLAAGGDQLEADEARDVPYLGLSSFAPGDAGRYFGRSAELARATRLLEEHHLTAVVGPSGVGKSSFVSAGLYPALDRAQSWHLISLRPGPRPMLRLATELVALTGSSESPAALAHTLARDPGRLLALLSELAAARRVRVLLFVDQFEELYTLAANPAERDAFARLLAAFSQLAGNDDSLRAIIALRSDFIDRVADQRILLEPLAGAFLFLPAPDRSLLRDALVLPLERFGYTFEDDALVDELITGLHESAAALPLLQFVASRLWAARDREHKTLTRACYLQIGAVEGALAAHADAVVRGFSPDERGLLRLLFLRLVTPSATRDVVAQPDLCSLASERPTVMAQIIERLARERLLVVRDSDDGTSLVEIVHESLIRSWPTLARWLASSRAHAVRLAELRSAARQWDNNQRSSGLLWAGDMAAEARTVARELADQLGNREREFVHAIELAESRNTRRRRTLRLTVMAVLILIATIATSAAVWVGQAEKRAREQADIAEAEAERARAAERERASQVNALEAEKRQREAAEDEAASARDASQMSRSQLATSNADLREALSEAARARQKLDKKRADLATANQKLGRTNAALAKKLEAERQRRIEQERLRRELAADRL